MLLLRVMQWSSLVFFGLGFAAFLLAALVSLRRGRWRTHPMEFLYSLSSILASGGCGLGMFLFESWHQGPSAILAGIGWFWTVTGLIPGLQSETFLDLLASALAHNPKAAHSTLAMLKHPWLTVCPLFVGSLMMPAGFLGGVFLSGGRRSDILVGESICYAGLGLVDLVITVLSLRLSWKVARPSVPARAYYSVYPAEARKMLFVQLNASYFAILGGTMGGFMPFATTIFPNLCGTLHLVCTTCTSPTVLMLGVVNTLLLCRRVQQQTIVATPRTSELAIELVLAAYAPTGRDGSGTGASGLRDWGVSLDFLRAFVREFNVSPDEPSGKVCERLIKEHTKEHRCSYFALIANVGSTCGKPWTGKHTVFVSHSWGTSFWSLLCTIEAFEATCPNEEHYYYIDLFGLNQHNLADIQQGDPDMGPPDAEAIAARLLGILDQALNMSQGILVAMNSYDNPAPFQRIWCLYEMWRASSTFVKPIWVGFPVMQAKRFKREVMNLRVDIEEFVNTTVDVRTATATKQADLDMIQRQIEADIGADAFNSLVRTTLMAYLVRCVVQTQEQAGLTDLEKALSSSKSHIIGLSNREPGKAPEPLAAVPEDDVVVGPEEEHDPPMDTSREIRLITV